MQTLARVVIYLLVMAGLLLVEHTIPPAERAFRIVVAFTFLIWLFVGVVFVIRGVWHLVRP